MALRTTFWLVQSLDTGFGLTLMLLTVARLTTRWRGMGPSPLQIAAMHRRGLGVVHGLIYASLFALGASGFVTGARSTWPSYLQGQLARAPELEHVASRQVHETFVVLLLVLIALHVGGVLVHEVRRGGVLRRMIPLLK